MWNKIRPHVRARKRRYVAKIIFDSGPTSNTRLIVDAGEIMSIIHEGLDTVLDKLRADPFGFSVYEEKKLREHVERARTK